ncbi:PAS domain S-box protein [Algoriphagus sp. NF]|jgi:PAS domain S-box-containing protein|uniref:PAS domain S-box protein n=1 Tax=Algoriphagus sp. NF TaxID=2992756 RepID=UPI001066CE9E|nr:PAS domain S-box protein [Algoriphagus sp. NF]MDE0558823.1 PAS domain S-box protein [Algoriphagus sp. NF]
MTVDKFEYKNWYHHLAEGVVFQDKNGLIFDANAAAEELLGLSLDQMKGMESVDPRWHTVHPDGSDFPGETHPAMISLKTGKPVHKVQMGIFNPKENDYTWILVNSYPIFLKDEQEPFQVFTTFVDISDQIIAERNLREEIVLHETLVSVSSSFIHLSEDQVGEFIQRSLEKLGKFLEADRMYIFDYDWENDQTSNTFEWCANEIEPYIDTLQNVPLEGLKSWTDAHRQGKIMSVSDVSLLNEDDALRQVLEPQGIQSILAIPVMVGNECVSFVGIDWVRSKHTYSQREFRVLDIFVGIYGRVKERFKRERDIFERLKELKSIYGISALSHEFYNGSVKEFLSKAVDIIPPGFFEPDETFAVINFDSERFESANFKETSKKIQEDIVVNGKVRGEVVVYITESVSFIPEEYPLLKAISTNIFQFIDASEKLREIKQSESQLKLLLESQSTYIVWTDLEGRPTYYNPVYEQRFGEILFDAEDEEGTILKSICEYHWGRIREVVEECIKNPGQVFRVELDKYTVDKKICNTFWEITCVTDQAGNPSEVQCIGIDYTAQKEASDQLIESEKRFQEITSLSGSVIWEIDLDGKLLYVSEASKTVYGYQKDELIGKKALNVFCGTSDIEECLHGFKDKVNTGKPVTFDLQGKHKDGEIIWINRTVKPVLNEKGEILKYQGSDIEITESKTAELEIKKLSEAIEQSNTPTKIVSFDGDIEYYNAAYKELLVNILEVDLPNGVAIGNIRDYFDYPLDKLSEYASNLVENKSSGKRIPPYRQEIKLVSKVSLKEVWFKLTVSPISNLSGEFHKLLLFYEDISDSKKYQEEILNLNSSLEEKIAARTQELSITNEVLEGAILDAKRANEAQRQFLSRMSHELRTPLNSILGFAQILQLSNLSDSQKRNLNFILESGNHLLNLINEVLEISRIEAGHIEVSLEPVELQSLISEVVDSVRTAAFRNSISISTPSLSIEKLFVIADLQRLKQVIINLINNAIKYNKPNGSISIEYQLTNREEDQEFIQIHFKDTGVGISEEDIPKLFTPFERGRNSTSSIEGTGLGLSVVDKLVQLMGGTVGVSSNLGEGSDFWIEIPLQKSSYRDLLKEDFSQKGKPNNKPSKSTILLVEDNPTNIELVQEFIKLIDPEIQLIWTMTMEGTIQLATEYHPKIILLDLNLPEVHGSEILEELKKNSTLKDIPVIIVSADATNHSMERMEKLGAEGYITKPMRMDLLSKIVDEYL